MGTRDLSSYEIACLSLNGLLELLAEEKNGRPNYGGILRYFRLLMGWTAAQLASLYSEALGLDEDHLITTSWIISMENQNRVPADEKRRWILARLLDIPPFLLGLNALSDVSSRQEEATIFDMLQAEKVDVAEYQTTLQIYNGSWLSSKLDVLIPDVKYRILNLQNNIPCKRGSERKQMIRLLCEYYTLLAEIAQQQQDFDPSIALLSKIISIAEINKFYDIWAMALRYRGTVYLDRGELMAGLVDFAAAKPDFEVAVCDFDAARKLEPHLASLPKSAVYLDAGSAYAYVAQDPKKQSEALQLLDMGKTMMGKDGTPPASLVTFDEAKCHMIRAKTLIASPIQSLRSPAAARKELEQATQLASPTLKLRHLSITVRTAESYYIEGSYDLAVASAENALEFMKDVDSKQNLTRLNNLHKRLKESSFGKNQEVAALRVKLFKVQHPELFA
jgi:tetratricopeptide (TPR) repeat protein